MVALQNHKGATSHRARVATRLDFRIAILLLVLLLSAYLCTVLTFFSRPSLSIVTSARDDQLPLTESYRSATNGQKTETYGVQDIPIGRSSGIECVIEECIDSVAFALSRAFPFRSIRDWCLHQPQPGRRHHGSEKPYEGLLLVKIPKGASSTAAGVLLRVVHKRQCSQHRWAHGFGLSYLEPRRRTATSFLFTTIRNPSARAISTLFFHSISRQKRIRKQSILQNRATAALLIPSDATMIQLLRNSTHPHTGTTSVQPGVGFQLQYMALQPPPNDAQPKSLAALSSAFDAAERFTAVGIHHLVESTVRQYDFIIVTEQMDESLVALSLLWKVNVTDVLVTSSKVAGSTLYHYVAERGRPSPERPSDGAQNGVVDPTRRRNKTGRCIPVMKSVTSPGVQAFMNSHEWRAQNYGDFLLHRVAIHCLNRTIHETIGYEKFQRALQEYRRWQKLEQRYCADAVEFPCSSSGVPQPDIAASQCYVPHHDFGCGYPCIDGLVANFSN
jgi:hypothetical protein